MRLLALLALLTTVAAVPNATRVTSWRYRVAGPGCSVGALELTGLDDVWPVLAAVGQNSSVNQADVFFDHASLDSSESKLSSVPGCAVVERVQGRPARNFLVPDGYTPPERVYELIQLLALQHPERAQLIDLTETLGTPPTQEGRHIFALKISDNAAVDEDEPNLLLVGMHHAREIMGPETVLLAAKRLLEGEGAAVKRLVDSAQIYLAWDWNPDGWRYVFDVDNSWRKNRFPNPDGSFGVDLNRNYPFGWDFSCGGSTAMTSNSYRGPSAGSEPEMQTMVAWQAQRKFNRIVDLHSFGRDVRQNYAACAELPTEVDTFYTGIVSRVAQDMGYVPVRSCCTGGEISYAYSTHGSMSILFEQGMSFQPPYDSAMNEIETENWPGILNFFRRPTPSFGHVRDASTGEGVGSAQLRTTDFAWNYGEAVPTSAAGRFHLWVPDGEWSVSVSAPGYVGVTVRVAANSASGVETEIRLQPSSSQ